MKKLVLLIVSLCLTACVSNTYLAKQQYMLQAHKPLFKAEKPLVATLTVEPTLASPPYDNVQFIYRLKDSKYLNDYYNIFMTEPATQITTALTEFLQKTNLFTIVNSADMTLASNYNLKTQVTELYADYTNDTRPKAVMEIQFILLDGNNIVYHTLLAAHAPLASKSTDALVKAWNKDLTIILTKFSLKLANQLQVTILRETKAQTVTSSTAVQTTAPNNNFLTLPGSRPAATTPTVKPVKSVQPTPDNDGHGFLRLY